MDLTVLLIGGFESLIFLLLIFLKHNKTISDYILLGFFGIYVLTNGAFYLESYNHIHNYPYSWIFFISTPLLFLHWPAIWLYAKSLTDADFRIKLKYLLNLLPFAGCLVLFYFLYYSKPLVAKISLIRSESFMNNPEYKFIISLMVILSFTYFYQVFILERNYNRKMKAFFSELPKYQLSWLRFFIVASITVYTLLYIGFLLNIFFPVTSFKTLQQISFISGSLYIIIIGLYGHRQGNLFASIDVDLKLIVPDNKPIDANKPNDKDEQFIRNLLDYMKAKRPFLSPDITLSLLAENLDVMPDYLSGIINNKLGKNFYDFINHYRIEEFKNQCISPLNKDYTLITIAYECGFNSKATFNRVFKNSVGMTPSEYIKGCENQRY